MHLHLHHGCSLQSTLGLQCKRQRECELVAALSNWQETADRLECSGSNHPCPCTCSILLVCHLCCRVLIPGMILQLPQAGFADNEQALMLRLKNRKQQDKGSVQALAGDLAVLFTQTQNTSYHSVCHVSEDGFCLPCKRGLSTPAQKLCWRPS